MRAAAPNVIWLTCGHAEGDTRLNAFDNALVGAGIGHWNLVKVTSVAPQMAALASEPLAIEPGALVPTVLTSCDSERPGQLISACIGIGLGAGTYGMIMEHSGSGTPEEMEAAVRGMLHESFVRRGLELERVVLRSVSHTVKYIGACVAAAVLWWR